MKITLSQMLLLGLFGSIALAHDTHAQEVLNRTITLNQKNLELKDALRQIEREAKVKFVYSTRIQSGQRISLNVTNRKLSAVLDELLTPVGINYEVIENRILLTKWRSNRSSLADPEF
ncbi:STN domain-containing protein, partial [Persicitalea sp.]|uniref:STN domain-containing protein n=1 Tax=Persicitalea sp. TaxID=3100273 RepID=UPI0035930A15